MKASSKRRDEVARHGIPSRAVIGFGNRLLAPTGAGLLAIILAAAFAQADSTQYILFHRAPGVAMHQAHPESFEPGDFTEVACALGTRGRPGLRIGVAFTFDYLRDGLDAAAASLERFLECSRETGIPVQIGLDGQNWWEARPDLWNWWDPSQPGYNPENRANVEWTQWDQEGAVKICWRNWGRQLRVLPAPNIMSPAVLDAHAQALARLVPIIDQWRRALPPNEQYLFAGVRVGHEASIGVNAFHYPEGNRYLEQHPHSDEHDPTTGFDKSQGWTGGLQPIGYAAVRTAGLRRQGPLRKEDIAQVVHRYLAFLARHTHRHGIPASHIFTHQGGTFAPWEEHLPFHCAINPHSQPGWSFYALDPREIPALDAAMEQAQRQTWAAVEWWWGAPDASAWVEHFQAALEYRQCRAVTVFNWDQGYEFRNEAAGHRAIRKLVRP